MWLAPGSREETIPTTETEGESGPYVARGCRGVRGTRGPWPAVGNTAGMVESNGQSSVGDGGRLAGVVCGVVMVDRLHVSQCTQQ